MKKSIHKSIEIHAPKERIWDVLLKDRTYRIWSAEFAPGSHAEGDWGEGSFMYFKDSRGNAMFTRVVKHVPGQILEMEYQGPLGEGEPSPDSPETQHWKGYHETYELAEKNGSAQLIIDQDVPDEYYEFIQKAWAGALEKVKILCEEADTSG